MTKNTFRCQPSRTITNCQGASIMTILQGERRTAYKLRMTPPESGINLEQTQKENSMQNKTKIAKTRLSLISLLMTALSAGWAGLASGAGSLATPTLSGVDATKTTIDLSVAAGSTGCAAGFSLHWQTSASYQANGNVFGSSGDGEYCAASFSGVPGYNQGGGTTYSLAAYAGTVIRIGDILLDQGASASDGCDANLQCNTTYVVRAFCHAVPKGLKKSDFSSVIALSTKPCVSESACTLSQGYWKTHSKSGPASEKNIIDGVWDGTYISTWPVDGLVLGNLYYNEQELVNILNTTGRRGNGLPALAHQLIAVKLDEARGTILPEGIVLAVTQADQMIGNLVPGVDSLPSSMTSGLTTILDNFIQDNHCTE